MRNHKSVKNGINKQNNKNNMINPSRGSVTKIPSDLAVGTKYRGHSVIGPALKLNLFGQCPPNPGTEKAWW